MNDDEEEIVEISYDEVEILKCGVRMTYDDDQEDYQFKRYWDYDYLEYETELRDEIDYGEDPKFNSRWYEEYDYNDPVLYTKE